MNSLVIPVFLKQGWIHSRQMQMRPSAYLYLPRPLLPLLCHLLPCPLHHFPSPPFAIPNPWRSRQSKRRVFAHSKKKMGYGRTYRRTDGLTDGRTDGPSYRVARMHLKRKRRRKIRKRSFFYLQDSSYALSRYPCRFVKTRENTYEHLRS